MFGENNVPSNFSLSPDKARYLITEALGPYFKEKLCSDAFNSFYCIQYDETTNSEGAKELQVGIRFWSQAENCIISRHLQTFFLGHATAEILMENLLKAVNNASLPLKNLLTLASDGPNTNKKVFRLLNEEMKNNNLKPLIDIGTCGIHSIHNSFCKGMAAFGEDAADLVLKLFYYFHGWPTRSEDFENLQNKMKIPNKKFLKHVNTRWLTIGPAVSRVLEMWPVIEEYFFKYVPQKQAAATNTSSYKTIFNLLKIPTMKVELHFMVYISKVFTNFTLLLQKQEPLIHILYDETKNLIKSLLLNFLKKDLCSDDFTEGDTGKLFALESYLPVKQITCGSLTREEILKLPERSQLLTLKQIQEFYIKACKYLMEKSPISNRNFRYFRCLNPISFNLRSKNIDYYVTKAAQYLNRPQINDNVDQLINEFKLLSTETVGSFCTPHLKNTVNVKTT